MTFWEKLAAAIRQVYDDLLALPPITLLLLSILALFLAASIASGFHP